MIHYNNPKFANERAETKPMTLEQDVSVVSFLNKLINFARENKIEIREQDEQELQFLINNYENLNHFKSVHVGLFATTNPDKVQDPENTLFKIEF